MKKIHSEWMKYALREAVKAFDKDEVPIGCIIVYNNSIIAKSHNQIETLNDPTAHSEMIALTSAFDFMQNKKLDGCSMYTTLEPCVMCAGAIVLSKIQNLYFGAYDLKAGACGSILNITNNKNLNHKTNVYGGILDLECKALLQEFFKKKRKGKDGKNNFSLN